MSSSLPLYNFSLIGSTPRSTIPLLWESSRKSGTVPCFFSMGVLPEALNHFCGSTPAKVVKDFQEYFRRLKISNTGSSPRHGLRVVEITSQSYRGMKKGVAKSAKMPWRGLTPFRPTFISTHMCNYTNNSWFCVTVTITPSAYWLNGEFLNHKRLSR